jgi:hypothetical protein
MMMIGAALAIGAALIAGVSRMSGAASRILDGIAVVAAFLFFVIAADAVMETLARNTVFMTEVHRVLENPAFLASGAYLGPYAIGRIAMLPAYLFSRR